MSEFKYSNNVESVIRMTWHKPKKPNKLRWMTARISPETYEKLAKFPNRSQIVRKALNDFFNKMEERKPKK